MCFLVLDYTTLVFKLTYMEYIINLVSKSGDFSVDIVYVE